MYQLHKQINEIKKLSYYHLISLDKEVIFKTY